MCNVLARIISAHQKLSEYAMHGLDDCGMMRHGYGYGVLSHVVSGCVGCALGL